MTTAPAIRPVPNSPTLRWNEAAKRYIGPNGRFVPTKQVRGQLDKFIKGAVQSMDDISRALVNGEIGLGAWQTEMMVLTKDVNLAGGALQRGGWYQMRPEDFGRVGQKVRGEYGFLDGFAGDIASGKQKLDGTLPSRSRLYGEQARATYYDFSTAEARADGFDEERSRLQPAESCEQCIGEDRKSWVPIGNLIPIGDRTCLSNCRCTMEYRKKESGETRTA